MSACTCRGGWETFSGHRMDCPRNAAPHLRDIERDDRDAQDDARRSGALAGPLHHVFDEGRPSPAEYL